MKFMMTLKLVSTSILLRLDWWRRQERLSALMSAI